MSEMAKALPLALLVTLYTGGCQWIESFYVTELKTSGIWTGQATVVTTVPHGAAEKAVRVASLHIEDGPQWTDPGHRKRENVIGKDAVLIDDNKRTFAPDTWPEGSSLRVQGLMKSDTIFDHQGMPLYPGPQGRYQFITIRVKSVQLLRPTARTRSETSIFASNAATAPATAPSIKLTAKVVSDSQIDLSWTPVADATAYRIEISRDGKDFYDSVELDPSEPRCSNTDFPPNEQFFFRVTAVGDAGDLGTSNTVDATTLPRLPTTKTGLSK